MNTTRKMVESEASRPKIDKVLVVISPDLVEPGDPEESTLINRAVALAQATGCELELFHVCHDSSLIRGFFQDDDVVRREREKYVDRNAMLMAEIAVRLSSNGVRITHDTRWDTPRTDAIMRKINASQPDLVMKQSREHGYVMGLLGNTDWNLIRQSPAHLWFVTQGSGNEIDRFVTAVGADRDSGEMISAGDYNVFRLASAIAEGFGAKNYPVNAFQVPQSMGTYAAYSPVFSGFVEPQVGLVSFEERRQEVANKHGRSVEAFAEYFRIDPQLVQIVEGHPAEVLPRVAESLEASLIVMAARNLSPWRRLLQPAIAEPVLAEASCDVLYVKENVVVPVPVAQRRYLEGVPAYDLEQIITDPARAFSSPMELAETSDISIGIRIRILQIWEQDIRAKLAEENEGGIVGKPSAHNLVDILKARVSLEANGDPVYDEPEALTQ